MRFILNYLLLPLLTKRMQRMYLPTAQGAVEHGKMGQPFFCLPAVFF